MIRGLVIISTAILSNYAVLGQVCCYNDDATCGSGYNDNGYCVSSEIACTNCGGIFLDELPETEPVPAPTAAIHGVCCYNNDPTCGQGSDNDNYCALSESNCLKCNGIFYDEAPPTLSPSPVVFEATGYCCFGNDAECAGGYTAEGFCAVSASNCGSCNGFFTLDEPDTPPTNGGEGGTGAPAGAPAGVCCYNNDAKCTSGVDLDGFCTFSEANCLKCNGLFFDEQPPTMSPTPPAETGGICCWNDDPTCQSGFETEGICTVSAENCIKCNGLFFTEMPPTPLPVPKPTTTRQPTNYAGPPGICCYNGDANCQSGYSETGYCARSPGQCESCNGLFFEDFPPTPVPNYSDLDISPPGPGEEGGAGVCCYNGDTTCRSGFSTTGYCTASEANCVSCNGMFYDNFPPTPEPVPEPTRATPVPNPKPTNADPVPTDSPIPSPTESSAPQPAPTAAPPHGYCCYEGDTTCQSGVDDETSNEFCSRNAVNCFTCSGIFFFDLPDLAPTPAVDHGFCCFNGDVHCQSGLDTTGFCSISEENCLECDGLFFDEMPEPAPVPAPTQPTAPAPEPTAAAHGFCCWNLDSSCLSGYDDPAEEGYCSRSAGNCANCQGLFFAELPDVPDTPPAPSPTAADLGPVPAPTPAEPGFCCWNNDPTCQQGYDSKGYCALSAGNCANCVGGLFFTELPTPPSDDPEPGFCCYGNDADCNSGYDSTSSCALSKTVCETDCDGIFYTELPPGNNPAPTGVCCYHDDATCKSGFDTLGYCTYDQAKCEQECAGIWFDELPILGSDVTDSGNEHTRSSNDDKDGKKKDDNTVTYVIVALAALALCSAIALTSKIYCKKSDPQQPTSILEVKKGISDTDAILVDAAEGGEV